MGSCPESITITSQADIDNGVLLACTQDNETPFNQILIHGVEGRLVFNNLTYGYEINVDNSPGLESLEFPALERVKNFTINRATSLSDVSLPKLAVNAEQTTAIPGGFSGDSLYDTKPSLQISDCSPSLSVDISSLTALESLSLIGDTNISLQTDILKSIQSLDTDTCVPLPNVTSVSQLRLAGFPIAYESDNGAFYCRGVQLPSLGSVGDLILSNYTDYPIISHQFANLTSINGSFTFGPSLSRPSTQYDEGDKLIDLKALTSVGGDVTIFEGFDTAVLLDSLTTVGNMDVRNNRNCSIEFPELTSARNLSITDNVGMSLPRLLKLEFAESIHYRGYVDPKFGPNIFPSLRSVTNMMTIEAWNADFNCSKLVSQFNDQIIGNLNCNGTNGVMSSTSDPGSEVTGEPGAAQSSPVLSQGAWAGIGVSIVAVVGFIAFMLWRRSLRPGRRSTIVEVKTSSPTSVNSSQTVTDERPYLRGKPIYEAEGRERVHVQEMPHNPVYEMAGR